jgi:hypothetical protein
MCTYVCIYLHAITCIDLLIEQNNKKQTSSVTGISYKITLILCKLSPLLTPGKSPSLLHFTILCFQTVLWKWNHIVYNLLILALFSQNLSPEIHASYFVFLLLPSNNSWYTCTTIGNSTLKDKSLHFLFIV